MIIALRILAPIFAIPSMGGIAFVFLWRSADTIIKALNRKDTIGGRASLDDYVFAIIWPSIAIPLAITALVGLYMVLSFSAVGHVALPGP